MSAPFESLRAVSLSNRSNWFMAQTSLKPHLMLADKCRIGVNLNFKFFPFLNLEGLPFMKGASNGLV